VEPGETAVGAAEREVAEEAGVTVKVTNLLGVYTDPGHAEHAAVSRARARAARDVAGHLSHVNHEGGLSCRVRR
jgi:ADP-ribose pyrophosphatase YjhB (NUDIX family)